MLLLYDSHMDRMKWIIFICVVIAVIGGIVWFNRNDTPAFTGDPAKIITEGPIPDNVYGTTDQKVVLIEYGDFQCPACGNMFGPVKALKEKHKDKLTFIFRNFPLTSIHPNALASSAVAEAAGRQGKFWEMHDLLYQTQQSWSTAAVEDRTALFEMYATTLGLDVAKFKLDLADPTITEKINRDRKTGGIYKVNSTPTFVIDGKVFDTTKSTDSAALTAAVEEAIAAAYGETSEPTQ